MDFPVFEKLLAFNHWANKLYLETFSNNVSTPDNCLKMMSHIIGAEVIWLQRINAKAITLSAFEPKTAEVLIAMNTDLTEKWVQKIAEIREKSNPMNINYKNLEGVDFSSTFEDILIHICNHGTYHRAQIAQELKMAGIKPPSTDFIIFSRT